jgi:hypothetical protein
MEEAINILRDKMREREYTKEHYKEAKLSTKPYEQDIQALEYAIEILERAMAN